MEPAAPANVRAVSALGAMPDAGSAAFNGSMKTLDRCPACGHPDTLLALGARYERPHRWRPWVTAATPLFLYDRCDAIVELAARSEQAATGAGLRNRATPGVVPSVEQPVRRPPRVVFPVGAASGRALQHAS
jgi:hypothetical protein